MDIEQEVHRILIEELGCDEADLLPNADIIDDLGADSLDLPAIAIELETSFSIVIQDSDFEDSSVKTVQQLIEFVQSRTMAVGKVAT